MKTKEEEEAYNRVQEFLKTLPPFDYGPDPLNDTNIKRITRPPVELNNGVIYKGEWDENGLRNGRGL